MLAADGGGGGGTPWYNYSLPTMWQIVNGQDTETIFQQASSWKNTADLTILHMANLQQYKDQLAEAWPPERSPASAAYMAELDKLINSIKETNETASANYNAVVTLALAASDAKVKLKPLYDEYQANAQKLADYDRKVQAAKQGSTPTPTPTPSPMPGPPPVATGRQEQLNNQARAVMYNISSEITSAGAALKPPMPYTPPVPAFKDDPSSTGGAGTTSSGGSAAPLLVPPVIPPVHHTPTPPPSSAPTPPPAPPASSGSGGSGLVLSGTPMLPPPAAPSNMPPVIQPPPTPTPAPLGVPTTPIGPLPGRVGPGTAPPMNTLSRGMIAGGGAPGEFGVGGRGIGSRPMGPGGVIGGQPGAGLARPGGAGPVSRVNPSGGVIGGQSGRQAGGAYGQPGRSGRRRDEHGEAQHWDPDNPWETEEGVTPVVLPADEPRPQNPGPAIGQGW